MSLSSWRSFNFFDLSPIKDPSSPDEGLLYSDPNITTICKGRNNDTAFIATNTQVKEFTADMQLNLHFTAYEEGWTITTLRFLYGTSLLLTLAEKQGEAASLHLWDLSKMTNDGRTPHCHTSVNITNGSNTFPLSAFALNSDYTILGFGYADGTVILARGDIIHDRGSRQRVVYNSTSPITGLEFHEDSTDKVTTLYVTTVGQVLTLPTHGRNPGKAETILDKSNGCAVGCAIKDPSSQELIVARDEGIAYYTPKLRGSSFLFDVPKKGVFPYQQYLVISTHGSLNNNGGIDRSTTRSNILSSLVESSTTRVIIIDTLNKYIAFSGQIANGIRDIFVQWDRINILGLDGVLYAIKEKDLDKRLGILKQRHLYDLAIQVAMGLDTPEQDIKQIQRDFGDYLYSEGEFDEAMLHYIAGIDGNQTSQVILKYRESQHIGNLTSYLEDLHVKGYATKEHTTLLLNSYAKMKNVDKLAQFIEQGADNGNFDFETATKICRQSGYFALATYLAQKVGDSDLAVLILLRDLHDYKGCLEYIHCLQFNDALNILIQHSRILLDEHPVETTGMLIDLFTGKFVPKALNLQLPSLVASEVDEPSHGTPNGTEPSSSSISAPVLQSYHAFVNYMSKGVNGLGGFENGPSSSSPKDEHRQRPTYQPPKPRLIFSSFIDHPSEFVIFLEACLECYDDFEGDEKNKVDLAGTLFEMYLSLANRAQNTDEKKQWQKKARNLGLQSNINQNTLLLLSHLASFSDGELLEKNQREGYQIDQFRACAAVGDIEGAKKILHKYGDRERELFPLALTFFTSTEQTLKEAGEDEFQFVLDRIKRDRLMAPLQVIQALSVNSVASVGLVRQYLIDLITAERSEIENNQKLAQSYRSEAKAKQEEVDKLLSDPMVVQYTLCSSCNLSLDLPAVHFACKHSYHQRCLASLGESTDNPSCPKCQPDLENIQAIRQAQDEISERNDLFQSSLKESDQKFKVITDFFGRGGLSSA